MKHSKLKVLLIEPSGQWVTNNTNLNDYEQVMYPIGLMYLSSFIKRDFDERIEVKIISTAVDFKSQQEMDAFLLDYKPDIVGIRSVIFYEEYLDNLVNTIHETFPNTIITVGGPNVNTDVVNEQRNKNISIFVLV